jgi:hypothetical protein
MAMGIVFPGWSNANEHRGYPFHDLATKEGPDGTKLPEGVIVDANIMVPESAGRFVFASSVAVTPGLVSVTFLATDRDPFSPETSSSSSSESESTVPLAAISVQKPITPYKNYAIDPLYPGVAGWVAFGSDVEEIEQLSVRLTSPEAGLLNSRAARSYRDYPIQSLGKFGRVTELTGLIQLQGAGDVVVEKAIRSINGRKREVVKIGLDLSGEAEEILRRYAGPCGERPEDRTCTQGKPFLTINGVKPDCDGNIDIIFEGLDPQVTSIPGGIIVDLPIGLDDVCSTFDPERYDPEDLCEEEPSSSSSELPPSSSSSSSSLSSSSSSPAPPIDEYYDDFSLPSRTFEFMIPRRGTWNIQVVDPSEATVGRARLFCIDSKLPSVITVPQVPKNANPGYRTFALIRPYTTAANGHVVFGYKGDDEFWYAGLSLDTEQTTYGRLYVGHKTGDLGSSLDDWPAGLEFGYQFDIAGLPDLSAGSGIISPDGIFNSDIRVEVKVEPLVSDSELSLVTVEWYWNRSGQGLPNPATPFNAVTFATGFDLDGQCGLGGVACETHFDNFGIFNLA